MYTYNLKFGNLGANLIFLWKISEDVTRKILVFTSMHLIGDSFWRNSNEPISAVGRSTFNLLILYGSLFTLQSTSKYSYCTKIMRFSGLWANLNCVIQGRKFFILNFFARVTPLRKVSTLFSHTLWKIYDKVGSCTYRAIYTVLFENQTLNIKNIHLFIYERQILSCRHFRDLVLSVFLCEYDFFIVNANRLLLAI